MTYQAKNTKDLIQYAQAIFEPGEYTYNWLAVQARLADIVAEDANKAGRYRRACELLDRAKELSRRWKELVRQ